MTSWKTDGVCGGSNKWKKMSEMNKKKSLNWENVTGDWRITVSDMGFYKEMPG